MTYLSPRRLRLWPSAVLLRRDLSATRRTRRGRYVLEHMPPSAQAVRMLGQTVVWYAAYRHRPVGIVISHAIVGVGWSHGLLRSAADRAFGNAS
jgi:hypothetical protein